MSQSTQRMLLILGSIVVIALGAVLIISSIGTPTAPAPRSAPPSQPAPTATGDIPHPEIARVSLGDAKAALDLQQAVFLDVRDPESYAASHIAGAISIPLAELENRLGELDQNAWILTYCT